LGLYDDLKAAALAVHRLTVAEKALAEQSAESRKAIAEIRTQLQDIRDRQIRLEARLDGLDDAIVHRANAAAMAAVSSAFAILAQRIAALESAAHSGPPAAGAAGTTLPLDRAPGKP
jgi:hypothetical protein